MRVKAAYILIIVCTASVSVAQEVAPSEFSTEKDHYHSLVEEMDEGEEKARLELASKLVDEQAVSSSVSAHEPQKTYPSFYQNRPRSSDEQILELLDQVQNLKAKVIHTKTQASSTESSIKEKKVGARTYYNYMEGKIYKVHAGVDRVTDIELQADETLTNAPLAGDTVRWKIGVVTSGKGASSRTHLILKPLEENIETNILIPTSKRVYHLRAISGDWYMPSIAWRYPEEQAAEVNEHLRRQQDLEPVGMKPEDLSFSYHIEGSEYSWRPLRVFDDGAKTYFQMPEEMSVAEAPVLFVIDEHGEAMLVNYRVKGAYYILDRLIDRAQMRVGKKGIISIYSKNHKPSLFERLF